MSEIALHTGTGIAEQMEYAKAVSSGDLLPAAYKGKPANVLIAVGLGQAMGLSPAESLYRIDVIQGKPTASGELIAANVRKAGHKLRLRLDEQNVSATATIIRADDPDYEHTVTRDMKWAKDMGLAGKDNYKKQPLTMLQWRAVSAAARLACPEALYGVAYTADELRETPGFVEHSAPTATAADFVAADEPVDGEVVEDTGEAITDRTRGQMFALLQEAGITDRDAQIRGISQVIGRPIESRSEVTEAEGLAVIESLRGRSA